MSAVRPGVTTTTLTPARWPDLEAVLGPSQGCEGCWCFNHHIPPGGPDQVGDPARRAKQALVLGGGAGGVLGYLDGEPMGWCAVDPRKAIPGHDLVDGEDPDRPAIHCLFVRPEGRGRGLAGALVEAAIEAARAQGALAIEGYSRPEDPAATGHDFLPAAPLFTRRGFQPARSRDPAYARWVLEL